MRNLHPMVSYHRKMWIFLFHPTGKTTTTTWETCLRYLTRNLCLHFLSSMDYSLQYSSGLSNSSGIAAVVFPQDLAPSSQERTLLLVKTKIYQYFFNCYPFKGLSGLSTGLAESSCASIKDSFQISSSLTQLTPRDQLLWAVISSTIGKKKKNGMVDQNLIWLQGVVEGEEYPVFLSAGCSELFKRAKETAYYSCKTAAFSTLLTGEWRSKFQGQRSVIPYTLSANSLPKPSLGEAPGGNKSPAAPS